MIAGIVRAFVRPFGYTTVRRKRGFGVVKRHDRDLVYLHDYSGGYDEYRDTQVFHNRRKLDKVWADDATLGRWPNIFRSRGIAAKLESAMARATAGSRNAGPPGLSARMIGTDISETATAFRTHGGLGFSQRKPRMGWRLRFHLYQFAGPA
ncbi:MAG: hypothetical protein R3D84_17860 [Paracoccaceae bacterium]